MGGLLIIMTVMVQVLLNTRLSFCGTVEANPTNSRPWCKVCNILY